ncbi:MAG: cell division protein ZipA C-terminal FtsZ-binding domain-containing protein [Woeseiaceae bacterium]|nr:cell division protein ZipA C-terminal FtsZ-binding domain-containing protein [Woeseiaceae bacterium]
MDGLRWLLLIVGVLVIAGIYWYSRRESAGPTSAEADWRQEPSVGTSPGVTGPEPDPADEPRVSDDANEELAPPREKIVTLRLVAGRRGAFAGDELALGLRRAGLRHGKFGIFHYYDGEDEDRVVFSAASLVEPGSFDLANLKDQKFPGISLFMVLPGPLEGARAFDTMMTAARSLTQELGAELLDESGSTLSIQRERYLREEIIEFQHGIKVA